MKLLKLVPDNTNTDFMRWRNLALILSLIATIASIVVVGVKGLNLGVDFVGGQMVRVTFAQPIDVEQLRSRVDQLQLGDSAIQESGGPRTYQIRLPRPEGGEAAANAAASKVRALVEQQYQGARVDAVETVSGKVSEELATDGALSILFAADSQVGRGAHGVTPTSNAARGLELLRKSGLLQHILPELAATITCEQSPDFHPEGTVFEHLKFMLSHLPPDAHPLLPWAVLMHDIAKPLTASRDPQTGSIHFYEHEKIGAKMAEEILERLRFPRKQIEEVAAAVRYHMQFKDAMQMRKSTLRRLLLRETFPLELQLHRSIASARTGGWTFTIFSWNKLPNWRSSPQSARHC